MEKAQFLRMFWAGALFTGTLLLGACNANAAPAVASAPIAAAPAAASDTASDTVADTAAEAPEQAAETGPSEQGGSIAERSLPAEAFDLMNPRARNFTDLSGKWNYLPDPFREGLRKKVIKQYSIFNDQDDADVAPHDLKEYDFAKAPTLNVPGSWTAQVPELSWYENLVWLRRRFEAAPKAGKRYFLHFGAANHEATVFLNGKKIGFHEGGFTPFVFDVTDSLKVGRNSLVVGVDSAHDDNSIPPPRTDWWNYGGITRPVLLIESQPTLVRNYWIRLEGDALKVDVALDGPSAANHKIGVKIPELGINRKLKTGAAGTASAILTPRKSLTRWSPENPKLYDVKIALGDATVADRIGFRTIAVEGDEILLNGKPIFLRGISMHEEKLGEIADRYLGIDGAKALLSEIKKGLNGNFVRLAHYPHAEETLKVADELGILVWSEVPVYWDVAFDNMDVLRNARTMLRDNILRDRNRASIIIWSVANETPIRESRNKFLTTMIEDVRALDSTRLVSQASNHSRHKKGGVIVDDPLAELVDLLSVNYYGGWYGGQRVETIPDVTWERRVKKPLIFSEFGAGAYINFSDPKTTRKFSVEYQKEIYEATIAMARKIPFLRGASPWVLKDFRSPRRFHSEYQEFWNRKGLMSETGEHKPAFDTLRAWYDEIEAEYEAKAKADAK